jgi:hypothetical protein
MNQFAQLRRAEHGDSTGRRRSRSAPAIGGTMLTTVMWLSLGVAVLTLHSLMPEPTVHVGILGFSILAILFGLWVFWRHGDDRISTVGVYAFCFALFVGFAGLYHATSTSQEAMSAWLLRALAWCYFLQVVTWKLFWADEPTADPIRAPASNPEATRWAVRLGVALLGGSVLVAGLTETEGVQLIANAAAFCGIVFVGVGLVRGRSGHRWASRGSLVAVAFGVYVLFLFDGFGRIVLGSLGFAFFIVLSHRFGGKLTKAVLLAGAFPVIMMLAYMRVQIVRSSRPELDENGLESVVWPVQRFAQLLEYEQAGVLPFGGGHTFWAALFALVPRAFWPEKPVGFGADLVPILRPELVGSGHSEAALFFGEWIYNFGAVGLLLMVPTTGILLGALDRLLVGASQSPLGDRPAIVRYAMAVVAAAGVIDILWGGAFAYMTRTGSRIAILLVIWTAAAAGARIVAGRTAAPSLTTPRRGS